MARHVGAVLVAECLVMMRGVSCIDMVGGRRWGVRYFVAGLSVMLDLVKALLML
jgi:hypothetical protein